jgi:signal transduction histidine kinase
MNPHTNNLTVTKLRNYRPSAHLFKSLISPKPTPEQPGQFVTALAHEVRNPLSNINLAVEMLRSTIIGEDQKLYLDIIMRGSERINDQIAALLTSCQPDEIKPERHSVHLLLDEVLTMTEDRIMLKNITVRKDYTTISCKILVNKQKIQIALTNIIINAIDAMPPQKGELILITRSMNGKCIIEIKDNGAGISKGNLEKIFKPYFTNKPGGMGLGLSTTLNILQLNHARVDVRSEEGKGTSFILTFDGIPPSGKVRQDNPFTATA